MKKYKVLIVDDSIVYRKLLESTIGKFPQVEVMGKASDGELALKKMELEQPDLVLLDVFMPGMNGLEVLKVVRKKYPEVSVVVISGMTKEYANLTVESLENGALDFLEKPQEESFEANQGVLERELKRILRLMDMRNTNAGNIKNVPEKESTPTGRTGNPFNISNGTARPFNLIAIGSSTGGPQALAQLIPSLPADVGCPVVLVQHMPAMFTASLASNLARKSKITVREGIQGQVLNNNEVVIAPGGKHMKVVMDPETGGFKVKLTDEEPVNSCRPAVDVLFKSIAQIPKINVMSIILTGMGEDGAAGVAELKKNGAYSIAEAESSCVVYGMPKKIVDDGLADAVIPIHRIAHKINSLMKGGPCRTHC